MTSTLTKQTNLSFNIDALSFNCEIFAVKFPKNSVKHQSDNTQTHILYHYQTQIRFTVKTRHTIEIFHRCLLGLSCTGKIKSKPGNN